MFTVRSVVQVYTKVHLFCDTNHPGNAATLNLHTKIQIQEPSFQWNIYKTGSDPKCLSRVLNYGYRGPMASQQILLNDNFEIPRSRSKFRICNRMGPIVFPATFNSPESIRFESVGDKQHTMICCCFSTLWVVVVFIFLLPVSLRPRDISHIR